jgi:hypothetical protein
MFGYVLIVVGIAVVLYEIVKWLRNPKEGIFDSIYDLCMDIPLTGYIGVILISWGFSKY